jgi:hypothetical protein
VLGLLQPVSGPGAGGGGAGVGLLPPPQPASHKLKPRQSAVSLFFEIDMFKWVITFIISRILSESYRNFDLSQNQDTP